MTQEEFKKLFELHKDCKVTKATVKSFEKIVLGSYLLHDEIMNNDKLIPTNRVDGEKIWLSGYADGRSSWRDHIMGIGSLPHIFVSFRYKKDERSIPFWSCRTEDIKHDIRIAYSLWEGEMIRIVAKHSAKYGVSMDFDLDEYQSNYWFFRTRDIKIMTPIFYKDEKGHDQQISSWDMRQVITQKSNTFLGRTPKAIQDVISEYHEKIRLKAEKKLQKV